MVSITSVVEDGVLGKIVVAPWWQVGVAERLEPKPADLSEWSARANDWHKGGKGRLGVAGCRLVSVLSGQESSVSFPLLNRCFSSPEDLVTIDR